MAPSLAALFAANRAPVQAAVVHQPAPLATPSATSNQRWIHMERVNIGNIGATSHWITLEFEARQAVHGIVEIAFYTSATKHEWIPLDLFRNNCIPNGAQGKSLMFIPGTTNQYQHCMFDLKGQCKHDEKTRKRMPHLYLLNYPGASKAIQDLINHAEKHGKSKHTKPKSLDKSSGDIVSSRNTERCLDMLKFDHCRFKTRTRQECDFSHGNGVSEIKSFLISYILKNQLEFSVQSEGNDIFRGVIMNAYNVICTNFSFLEEWATEFANKPFGEKLLAYHNGGNKENVHIFAVIDKDRRDTCPLEESFENFAKTPENTLHLLKLFKLIRDQKVPGFEITNSFADSKFTQGDVLYALLQMTRSCAIWNSYTTLFHRKHSGMESTGTVLELQVPNDVCCEHMDCFRGVHNHTRLDDSFPFSLKRLIGMQTTEPTRRAFLDKRNSQISLGLYTEYDSKAALFRSTRATMYENIRDVKSMAPGPSKNKLNDTISTQRQAIVLLDIKLQRLASILNIQYEGCLVEFGFKPFFGNAFDILKNTSEIVSQPFIEFGFTYEQGLSLFKDYNPETDILREDLREKYSAFLVLKKKRDTYIKSQETLKLLQKTDDALFCGAFHLNRLFTCDEFAGYYGYMPGDGDFIIDEVSVPSPLPLSLSLDITIEKTKLDALTLRFKASIGRVFIQIKNDLVNERRAKNRDRLRRYFEAREKRRENPGAFTGDEVHGDNYLGPEFFPDFFSAPVPELEEPEHESVDVCDPTPVSETTHIPLKIIKLAKIYLSGLGRKPTPEEFDQAVKDVTAISKQANDETDDDTPISLEDVVKSVVSPNGLTMVINSRNGKRKTGGKNTNTIFIFGFDQMGHTKVKQVVQYFQSQMGGTSVREITPNDSKHWKLLMSRPEMEGVSFVHEDDDETKPFDPIIGIKGKDEKRVTELLNRFTSELRVIGTTIVAPVEAYTYTQEAVVEVKPNPISCKPEGPNKLWAKSLPSEVPLDAEVDWDADDEPESNDESDEVEIVGEIVGEITSVVLPKSESKAESVAESLDWCYLSVELPRSRNEAAIELAQQVTVNRILDDLFSASTGRRQEAVVPEPIVVAKPEHVILVTMPKKLPSKIQDRLDRKLKTVYTEEAQQKWVDYYKRIAILPNDSVARLEKQLEKKLHTDAERDELVSKYLADYEQVKVSNTVKKAMLDKTNAAKNSSLYESPMIQVCYKGLNGKQMSMWVPRQ